jgi:hypothetical protein
MVWTHLVNDGTYTTTWWNSGGTVVQKAKIDELPTKSGESVVLPRGDRSEVPCYEQSKC